MCLEVQLQKEAPNPGDNVTMRSSPAVMEEDDDTESDEDTEEGGNTEYDEDISATPRPCKRADAHEDEEAFRTPLPLTRKDPKYRKINSIEDLEEDSSDAGQESPGKKQERREVRLVHCDSPISWW